MRFEDKVALVTGAGRGIGKAIALAFAKEGATLAMIDIDGDNLHAVYDEITGLGQRASSFVGDVSRQDDVRSMVNQTKKKYDKIDILINNAGISPKKDGRKANLIEIDVDEWNRVLAVNLTSAFLFCKEVLPSMMEQKDGRIISISSSSAFDGGFLAAAHYVTSKGGINAMTKTVAREVAPFGITVNAVAPGRVESPMAQLTSPERNKAALQKIPMNRFATTEDVSQCVLFLASNEAAYITGTTLNVSGGYVIF